jgi:hypothetical protein
MKRLALILVALLFLLTGDSAATKPPPAKPPIVVIDRTGPGWTDAVRKTVANFNAVMPPNGPRLVYQRAAAGCEDVDVCSGDASGNLGLTWFWATDPPGVGHIVLTDTLPIFPLPKLNIVCHEMMHALTHIGDNYDARPQTSCVWGSILTRPGRFDVARLQETYGHAGRPCVGIKNNKNQRACQRNHRR